MQNATLAKLAITAAVAVGGVGFLVYSSVAQAQHYRTVDALVTGGLDDWADKELKVHGFVVQGSILDTIVDHQMQHSFVLEAKHKLIRVFADGPVPDTFKDHAEVVATGRLHRAAELQPRADAMCAGHGVPPCPLRVAAEQPWVLDATEVSAKCPDHYSEEQKAAFQRAYGSSGSGYGSGSGSGK